MLAMMVLAAGLGTRLRPLTRRRAKALVPIGDQPALAHVLRRVYELDPAVVVVNAHHHSEQVVELVSQWPNARVSIEPELLGTAGGLANAGSLAGGLAGDGDVLVHNADTFSDADLSAFVRARRPSALATLLVRPRPSGEGSVGTDDRGRVVRLRNERIASEAQGGDFLGVHVIGESLRRTLPQRGCLVGDVYIPALRRGAELQAFAHRGVAFDIGTTADYWAANMVWLARSGQTHWTGEAACVTAGVTLQSSIVGAGARVTGDGPLARCVVWPGTAAQAPAFDAVMTGDGVVAVDEPDAVLVQARRC